MSIVAVGAVGVLILEGVERLGAKAEERSWEIFSADQVAVMLSLKSLGGSVSSCDVMRPRECPGNKCYMMLRNPVYNLGATMSGKIIS